VAIGRPSEINEIGNEVGEALSFTALAVEEPNLGFTSLAGRDEGEGLSVGAPAGMFGGDAFGGHGEGIAAGGGDHPDAGFGFVGLEGGFVDRVGDPLGIGAELGVVDGLDLEVVVDGDGARRGSLGERGKIIAKRRGAECTETERTDGREKLHADGSWTRLLANPNKCEERKAEFSTGAEEYEGWEECKSRDGARFRATIGMVLLEDACARGNTG